MEATATIQSGTSLTNERTEPFIVVTFSLVVLAVSLLTARYGLEVDPSLF
jgi:hypothetical protein